MDCQTGGSGNVYIRLTTNFSNFVSSDSQEEPDVKILKIEPGTFFIVNSLHVANTLLSVVVV